MGFPPPPDGPSPDERAEVSADAEFKAGPPVLDLCKFKLPSFLFKIKFKLPPINFPPKLPSFSLSLGLNCDLSNPLNVTAGVKFGGGRVSTGEPDPF